MHRIVDASLFYFGATGAAGRYSSSTVGSFISTAGRWASALQLFALATTLFAPRFTARNHELFKASCYQDLATGVAYQSSLRVYRNCPHSRVLSVR